MIKVGELFAGVGGISKAFENNGFRISWANEIDKDACITYRLNSNHKLYENDIHDLDPNKLEKVDIISAGFPCQAFSIAGLQKGFCDDRGDLFFQVMRFVDHIKPKVIFLENVKNLKTHSKGETFKTIKKELEKRGYYIKYDILNTCEYSNTPQNRERIYIIAFKNKKSFNAFDFPTPIKETLPVKSLLEKNVDSCFYYRKSKYYAQLKKEMLNKDSVYQLRRVYIRENKSHVCPTLTANMGTGGHNVPLIIDDKDIRKLTPRECFRLQSFKDSFKLPDNISKSALYKQAGNSVSITVIERIAQKIFEAIKQGEKNDLF